MNEIERAVKGNEDKVMLPFVAKFFAMVVIGGLVYNYYDLGNRYYQGEELITIDLKIDKAPVYVYGGKGGTNRFTFKANEYQSSFWISEGALIVVLSNETTRQTIERIVKGQVVTVDIYKNDIPLLKSGDNEIPIIGLSIGDRIVFSPKQTMEGDGKNLRLNLVLGTIALIGTLLGLNWKRLKRLV